MTAPKPLPCPTRLTEFGVSPVLAARGLGDSRLALGLAGLGGTWGPVDEGESLATILHALTSGVRVFDSAPAYGDGEKILGRALAQWRGPRPIVSTKIGRLPARDAHEFGFDHTSAGLRACLERSLEILGVPQVDLLFLHEPDYLPPAERPRVLAVLRQLQADGLARRLGLAGGHGKDWDGLLETGVFDVVMLFRRLDPCTFDGLADDLPRLRRAGVLTYGASPLHMGLLGARYDDFVRDRPDWIWGPQIERAIRLKALAERNSLLLRELSHRFMFSLAEIDRTVIGAKNRAELDTALADFAAGPLPAELFTEVCDRNY
jgi:aryl-alcohol dehydrogenase-like predicted oxidoreductase